MSGYEFLYSEKPAMEIIQINKWFFNCYKKITQIDSEVKESEIIMHRLLKEFGYE